jgi:Domain of unknown function (DUF4372)
MNRVCSVFRQILIVFSRSEFAHLARMHGAERHARGFTCWDQLVATLSCHLGRAQCLREICGGLASAEGNESMESLDRVIDALADYQWVIFTSTNQLSHLGIEGAHRSA